MTNTEQQIHDIELRWWRLVEQRQEHYNEVLDNVDRSLWVSTLEALNNLPEYEQQFDAMEKELRKLDPDHFYLAENQIEIY